MLDLNTQEVMEIKAAEPSASSGPSLMGRDALISHLKLKGWNSLRWTPLDWKLCSVNPGLRKREWLTPHVSGFSYRTGGGSAATVEMTQIQLVVLFIYMEYESGLFV